MNETLRALPRNHSALESMLDEARAEQKEKDYMAARGDPGLPGQSHLQAYWKGRADAANAVRAQRNK
jgi:hypothetical protein